MRLRRTHRKDAKEVIDLTDDDNAWWAAADHLVTAAPSFPVAEEAPPPPRQAPNQWAPETIYTFGPPDPHEVLGVDRDASWAEVERARRRLAKRYHPDLASGSASARELDLRARRMQAVNQAYEDIKQLRGTAGLD